MTGVKCLSASVHAVVAVTDKRRSGPSARSHLTETNSWTWHMDTVFKSACLAARPGRAEERWGHSRRSAAPLQEFEKCHHQSTDLSNTA
jgi:hypothetical protein